MTQSKSIATESHSLRAEDLATSSTMVSKARRHQNKPKRMKYKPLRPDLASMFHEDEGMGSVGRTSPVSPRSSG